MIRRWVFAVILLVMIFSVSQVFCQDEAKTVDGRVVSVDPQNSVIVVKSVETLTFSVTANAQITNQDGLDVELSDIEIGSYVMVGYHDNKKGEHITDNINVEYNR